MVTQRLLSPRIAYTEASGDRTGPIYRRAGRSQRAVAIAIRNRWRRQQLSEEMRQEVAPKNILMIGPTGVGKTEIARRLAKMTGAPFIKIEATKYTEVGYYGRDVESMIRELVENAIGLVRESERKKVEEEAKVRTNERLVDLLCPRPRATNVGSMPASLLEGESLDADQTVEGGIEDEQKSYDRTRAKIKAMLLAGELEQRKVEITVESKSKPMVLGGAGLENMDIDLQGMFEKMMPKSTSQRELTVSEARTYLFEQECETLLDPEAINGQAIELAENLGMIFLDEVDKIVATEGKNADVSRQGCNETCCRLWRERPSRPVMATFGRIISVHCCSAFHRAQPSELMPELQGRFPIRVELRDLTRDDFVRILKEPRNSLTRQYESLLKTEGVELVFEDDAILELKSYAFKVNQSTQNIGARRLYTILERLLEELSFEARK